MPRDWNEQLAVCVRRWKKTDTLIIVYINYFLNSTKDRVIWTPNKGLSHASVADLIAKTDRVNPRSPKAIELLSSHLYGRKNMRILNKLFLKTPANPIC